MGTTTTANYLGVMFAQLPIHGLAARSGRAQAVEDTLKEARRSAICLFALGQQVMNLYDGAVMCNLLIVRGKKNGWLLKHKVYENLLLVGMLPFWNNVIPNCLKGKSNVDRGYLYVQVYENLLLVGMLPLWNNVIKNCRQEKSNVDR